MRAHVWCRWPVTARKGMESSSFSNSAWTVGSMAMSCVELFRLELSELSELMSSRVKTASS